MLGAVRLLMWGKARNQATETDSCLVPCALPSSGLNYVVYWYNGPRTTPEFAPRFCRAWQNHNWNFRTHSRRER